MGLLGVDGGVVWLVAGVFTVRAVWGSPVGLAWALACLTAALRFGSLGLADVGAAARLVGPGVVAGTTAVRAGMILALAAAVLGEARLGGLRRRSLPERAVALAALVALVGLFCAPGPGSPDLWSSLGWWAGAGAGLVAVSVAGAPAAARVPAWLPVAAAGVGLLLVGLGS